jgi:cation:H+ antiporter
VTFYVAYVAYRLLDAADHAALGPYSAVMLWSVVPLAAVTLAALTVRDVRAHRR